MKRRIYLLLAVFLMTEIAGCSSAGLSERSAEIPSDISEEISGGAEASAQNIANKRGYVENLTIESEAVSNNLIDISTEKTLCVYLPPSYDSGGKKYPVVYYLHGFGQSAGGYIASNSTGLDKAFQNGAEEFIMVEIPGDLYYYVNSPVTGNWEDYVIGEVIPLIDQTYNSIADSASRGICGFSMGGFGAINLALRHPDVFGAVYSMSPGLLMEDGLAEAMGTWKTDSSF